MRIDKQKFISKLILSILGTAIMALGISLFLKANIGADSVTVWNSGLSKFLGVSYGTAATMFNVSTLIIAIVLSRRDIFIGTFIWAIGLGPFVDLFLTIGNKILPANLELWQAFSMMLLAVILLSFGIAVGIAIRFGLNTIDLILFYISNKTKIKYQWIKITMDFTLTIFGVIMGGVIGVGTILGIAIVGFLIVYFIRLLNSTILKYLNIDSEENNLPISNPIKKLKKYKIIKV